MTDEELSISDATLIARLRWKAGAYAKEAADRIEALVKERDKAALWATEQHACADNYALRLGQEKARAEQLVATNERLEAVLRELIDHTHNCEKELTERLYRADFCGESLPLTNARAALKGN